jgi:hypothetical protein
VTRERPLLFSKVITMLASDDSTLERANRLSLPVFSFRALTAA